MIQRKPVVLFWVQHLLGIGHVRRGSLIARALADQGAHVVVANGGHPVDIIDWGSVTLKQLPPVRSADAGFSALIDGDGSPIDDAWKSRRARALLELFAEIRPDSVLIEAFPFGRRPFRFELIPLLEAVHALADRPQVFVSLRDILVTSRRPGRAEETVDIVKRHVDRVLVHGDPALIPLSATFPLADRIADQTDYTGFVAATGPAPTPPGEDGSDEIVVSVGGGAVGENLLNAAVGAALQIGAGRRWRLLVGPDQPEAVLTSLAGSAPSHVVVERARPDFRGLLARAALSISQAGYNTVLDIVTAGCRAVLVPFAAPGETEQTDRATLLEERGRATVVAEAGLTADRLADAVSRTLATPAPVPLALALEGAAETARLILKRT